MMWIPVSLGISLVAMVLHSVFQPRLPQYSFRVRSLVPRWSKRRVQVGAGVKMHNDNFVAIDIHALSFDMFYPDWKGRLQHIGHVHDVKQQHDDNVAEEVLVTTIADASETDKTLQRLQQELQVAEEIADTAPLWALEPRQSFETIDTVLMQPPSALSLSVLSNLSWDILKLGGKLNLPSSGVIHLKANRQVPLTLSILCDNLLNTWTMELEGRSCTMDAMELGWVNMQNSVQRLRQKVLVPNTPEFEIAMSVVAHEDDDNDATKTTTTPQLSFQEEFDKLQRKHAMEELKTSALSYFAHYPTREDATRKTKPATVSA